MKQKQILSFTLLNGLVLLLFASFLASCQKNKLKHFGHFSVLESPQSRSIANSDGQLPESFAKYFDLKQVYIYCHINSVNEENCFEKHTQQILSDYENAKGPLEQKEKELITNQFKPTQKKVSELTTKILNQMQNNIQKLVNKREQFCQKNSTYYLDRCLNQYLENDTMAVLNDYQNHFKNINGHEYLFLQQEIKNSFKLKLHASYQNLNSKEKKS